MYFWQLRDMSEKSARFELLFLDLHALDQGIAIWSLISIIDM